MIKVNYKNKRQLATVLSFGCPRMRKNPNCPFFKIHKFSNLEDRVEYLNNKSDEKIEELIEYHRKCILSE